MINIEQLHLQIARHLQTLKRELDRLAVRQSALARVRLSVLAEKSTSDTEEEIDDADDILANIDAIVFDLTTFTEQMRGRLSHAERGLHLVSLYSDEKNAGLLYQHALDGVILCVSDATVARTGYDELITDIKEIAHLRDVE